MIILILAAGYGTRLQSDIEKDDNFKHLSNISKALLPIGDKPLIQYWIDFFKTFLMTAEKKIWVITNEFYYDSFLKWANFYSFDKSHIVKDGSTTSQNQLGSMGDINYFLSLLNLSNFGENRGYDEDDDGLFLVVGGDTLFPQSDLDLIRQMLVTAICSKLQHKKNAHYPFNLEYIPIIDKESGAIWRNPETCQVLCYESENVDTRKVGIIEISPKDHCRILSFLEKPHPEDTKSRLCCPCFYLFDKEVSSLVKTFLMETGKHDQTGFFIQYLIKKASGGVYAVKVNKRFDVGNLRDYLCTIKDIII